MAHHHDHAHHSTGDIRVAFFLNLGFTTVEIIGGIWTNSTAIVADALHDLGDSLSLGLAWFLDRYARHGRDATFSYGYRRFSLLGALVNAIVLLIGSVFVVATAIPRIIDIDDVERRLEAIEGVLSTHHTHIWSLDGEHHVLTTHVVVEGGTTKETMLQIKRAVLAVGDELECEHTTVEMEYEDEDCPLRMP